MGKSNWFKRKLALLAYALSNAENDALGQKGDALVTNASMSQTLNQGTMADALLRGEITLEVKELRWRMYKVLAESKGKAAKITGYDEDGMPIVETYNVDTYDLSKVNCDDADSYPVEMVVMNINSTLSKHEAFDGFDSDRDMYSKEVKKDKEMFGLVGADVEEESFTHGEISFDNLQSTLKDNKAILIERELIAKFNIEDYTKKLIVRNISEDEKLLEFYVSQYVDDFNRKSRLFISEIKKAIKNPRMTNMLDIDKVIFITEKALGVADGLEFQYEIKKFDKIVKHNGSYVIKYIAKPIINGEDIFVKYKEDDLEERYKNKEAK